MQIEVLEKELQKSKLNSIYLFYGSESYLIETNFKKIKKIFGNLMQGINYIQLDDTNVTSIISDIETPAFGCEKKLIIVKNSGLFKGNKKAGVNNELIKKVSKYIEDNFNIIDQSVVLVFIEQDVDKNELYKVIDKVGNVVPFQELKPVEIAGRLRAICYAYKVRIDDRTVQYLIECSGTNMQDLINEIRKLIEYVGPEGIITTKEIDLLATKQIESIIFDLTDNLGKRNINKALEVLNGLIYNKEPLQVIIVVLYRHFKKLYYTKVAEKLKKDPAPYLELKPTQAFLVNKYKQQVKTFKVSELRQILIELADLDANYKKGLIDFRVGLEAILCRYCG